ncbi:hypothetical protein HYT56_02020 [Candidatus Woesearchaeota archaeon]|nr:hypothetical protein [Candidatus Woesearchaeota archaeon]
MDKKVGVSVLFSLILIMSLVFVTKALDDIDTGDDTNDMLRSANISSYGDSFSNDSYIKGGTSEMINVTVTFGGGDANITNITIVIPAGNYSNFDGWLGIDDEFHGSCMADDVDEDATTCVPGE